MPAQTWVGPAIESESVELTLTVVELVAEQEPAKTETLSVTGDVPDGENVIAFVPLPLTIDPPAAVQLYVAPLVNGTLAEAVLPGQIEIGAVIVAAGCEATVTTWLAVPLQPAMSVAVTVKVVVEPIGTVITCDVAPVFHKYDAKPGPASSVTFPLPQTKFGPLIVTVGAGLTVTVAGDDVAEHPPAFVTVTL